MSGTNISGMYSCHKKALGAFSMIQEPTYTNVQKQIYDIALNTSTALLLLIFCISQGSVATCLRCGGKYGTSLVATAESNSEGIFKIVQHFSKL